ncbi:MraY family glycosyltransferase [Aquipuribacter hungaricus]|uniref:MraY family glycosyltransferase n=1 Tax=Aquipuribacter hungaricus TaxID=545624 RepID=A0ABV7WGH2_9MICO
MRAYLLVMAVAAVVTFLTTSPVRGVAVRLRALSPVRDRDVHSTPVPRLGGVAILAGFAAALGLASTVPFLAGTFGEGLSGPVGILLAGLVITVVGVVDDLVGLDALTKLVGQALAGVVMATFGVQLLVVPLGPGGIALLSGWVLTVLTVLVVVVTVNAVNFVDGLDGLAAGIVAIAGTAFFAYSYLLSVQASPDDLSSTASLVTAAMVGACLGFLPHNLHPARIFMGDSGALLLGLLLAASTISLTGSVDPAVLTFGDLAPAFMPLLLPFAALVVPVADVALAVVRRTAAGRSPFAPDKQHLHHRMLEIGHGHRAAVGLLHAWVALLAFGVVATAFFPWQEVLVVAAAVLVVVAVLTVVPLLVRRVSRLPVTEDGGIDAPAVTTTPEEPR